MVSYLFIPTEKKGYIITQNKIVKQYIKVLMTDENQTGCVFT